MENKKIAILVSVLISFVIWVIVTLVVSPVGEVVISGVGVNVNTQNGILGEMGLSAVYGGESTVNVTIKGSRSVIGGITPEDISIIPSLSGVSGSGTYDLQLVATNRNSKNFEIVSLSPETINVRFDKFVDKVVDLTYEIEGEYRIPDEFIQEQIYTTPAKVTVHGPESDMDKFDKAVIRVSLEGDYTESFTVFSEVELCTEDGNIYEYDGKQISLSDEKASLVIPIHHIVDFPVHFQYTGVPEYFDTAKLHYTLSADTIKAEGEKKEIAKYSDIFLGYVDLTTISLDNNFYNFNVELPKNIGNVSGEENIQVEFDLSDYEEKIFNVRQFSIINVPSGYKMSTNTTSINVKMIGPKNVIDSLASKDIVLQIDASKREINQTGQYKLYADVILPNKEFAWALGSYGVTVNVK